MDVLAFDFDSNELKKIQQEVLQLVQIACSVMIQGPAGSGKTIWSESLAKARGPHIAFNVNNAPQTFKDWRSALLSEDLKLFILEDVDRWSHLQRSSLLMFLIKFESFAGRFISTSTTSIETLLPQLYYRLATRRIDLPTPNECHHDLQKISLFWLSVHQHLYSVSNLTLSSKAIEKLIAHKWRGGWPELIMVLERAVSFRQSDICAEQIIFDEVQPRQEVISVGQTLAEMEKKLIYQTLQLTAANKSQAARLLGISIRTLRNKLNEYKERGAHESL
jgi:two-component system response regulator AtoC